MAPTSDSWRRTKNTDLIRLGRGDRLDFRRKLKTRRRRDIVKRQEQRIPQTALRLDLRPWPAGIADRDYDVIGANQKAAFNFFPAADTNFHTPALIFHRRGAKGAETSL